MIEYFHRRVFRVYLPNPSMRVLVLGVNGLLGSNVATKILDRGWEVVGTYHKSTPSLDVPLTQLDIQDTHSYRKILEESSPDVVINCAAFTDVDECERDPERAVRINGDAPGSLAKCSNRHGISFVHISTDYIFDGKATEAYAEDAEPAPVQVYGNSKLIGERKVRAKNEAPLIVRLSFVYGRHGVTNSLTGFPSWVLGQLENDDSPALFTDQWVTPSRAGQAAETILDLVNKDYTGTFHVASRSCLNPYSFGKAIARWGDCDEQKLKRGSIESVNREADRPRYTCLLTEKVEKALGRSQPTIAEDIAEL